MTFFFHFKGVKSIYFYRALYKTDSLKAAKQKISKIYYGNRYGNSSDSAVLKVIFQLKSALVHFRNSVKFMMLKQVQFSCKQL